MSSQMSNIEMAKIIQAFSNGVNIHSLGSISKFCPRIINRIVDKFEKVGMVEMNIGSGSLFQSGVEEINQNRSNWIQKMLGICGISFSHNSSMNGERRLENEFICEICEAPCYFQDKRLEGWRERRISWTKWNTVLEWSFTFPRYSHKQRQQPHSSLSPSQKNQECYLQVQTLAKVGIYACTASDSKRMPLIMFEKAERLTGVCYVQVLKGIKLWILSEHPEARDKGNSNKIAKDFTVTSQQNVAQVQ